MANYTLEELEQQRAALPGDDKSDISSTRAEIAALQQRINDSERRRIELDCRIANAKAAKATLAELPPVSPLHKWLADAAPIRAKLCDELLQIKSPVRDKRLLAVQQNLMLSIKCVDFGLSVFKGTEYGISNTRLGELMREAGYDDPSSGNWPGSLREVEQRVKLHDARRATAQSMLDDALLDDAERAKRDAESAELRDAFNAMRVKVGHDGRLVAYGPGGAVIEASAMTPLQRRAFERMDALQDTNGVKR